MDRHLMWHHLCLARTSHRLRLQRVMCPCQYQIICRTRHWPICWSRLRLRPSSGRRLTTVKMSHSQQANLMRRLFLTTSLMVYQRLHFLQVMRPKVVHHRRARLAISRM